MTTNPEVRTGHCLCNAVTYQLIGPSTKPIYNTVCHCTNCRRVTGSALFTASILPKEGFSITKGEEYLTTFTDTSIDSGTKLFRQFCSICGSFLFARTPLWDEIVSCSAGTLDDFEKNWRPDKEQYCIYRADFVQEMKGVAAEERWQRGVGKVEGGHKAPASW